MRNCRAEHRFSLIDDLRFSYEGRSECVNLRLPDLSPRGMFIHGDYRYPHGAVLKVQFRLSSRRRIRVRAEVRYVLPAIGMGVEFLDIADDDAAAIAKAVNPESQIMD